MYVSRAKNAIKSNDETSNNNTQAGMLNAFLAVNELEH